MTGSLFRAVVPPVARIVPRAGPRGRDRFWRSTGRWPGRSA